MAKTQLLDGRTDLIAKLTGRIYEIFTCIKDLVLLLNTQA